ncbi:MAG: hypothetical protein IPF79_02375 [Ignavibacteria bacterium]|nr:hypothetical protein [Ignavibacteria bacterium]
MTTLLDPSNSNVLYGSGPDGDLFRIRIAQQSVARITVGIDLKEESEWVALSPFIRRSRQPYSPDVNAST